MTSRAGCSSRSKDFANVTTPVAESTLKYCPDMEYLSGPFSGSMPGKSKHEISTKCYWLSMSISA